MKTQVFIWFQRSRFSPSQIQVLGTCLRMTDSQKSARQRTGDVSAPAVFRTGTEIEANLVNDRVQIHNE
jgi:hypothetical protein